jgi:hypothetical protein
MTGCLSLRLSCGCTIAFALVSVHGSLTFVADFLSFLLLFMLSGGTLRIVAQSLAILYYIS